MTLRLHPDVASTDTDDGMVLLHQRTGRYWQLNPTGSHVLRSLLEGLSTDQIATALADRHRIDPQLARRDVLRVVEQLGSARLLEGTP
ncbi:lasso peptide biosynthesis PqqD family chaperone [Streptomyces sp. NPDC021096]|uniref:lasso peptide biosynthesis PqqD family chaperone n=1 Tax=unclassified Streptomyces TaxID=2593676 RepID=UPI0033FF2AA4